MKNGELPAFANPGSDQGPGSAGLTKREYFAAMALQGYVASSPLSTVENAGAFAVKCADELLKRLEQ